MHCRRVVVLLALLTLWPSAAFAAKGWWGWLEELSGPGPFRGYGIAMPVVCTRDGDVVSCWSRQNPPKRLVVADVGRLGSGSNLRFKDLPDTPENRREVRALLMSGMYMFRLHPAVDVGFGAGTARFSGDDLMSVWRFTLPVGATVRPLAFVPQWEKKRWASLLQGQFEEILIAPGIKGSDFGSTSTFSTGPEWRPRLTVGIDVGAYLFSRP
jgi:hypothetical protein